MATPFDNIPGYGGYIAKKQMNEQQSLSDLMTMGKMMEMQTQAQAMSDAPAKRAREIAMHDATLGNVNAQAAERQSQAAKAQRLFDVGKRIATMSPDDPARNQAILEYRMIADPTQVFDPEKQNPSLFGKIAPNDYTPQSVAKFAQTKNYSDLVAAPKPSTHINMPRVEQTERVIDPVTMKPIIVSRSEAIKNRMTPAGLDAETQGAIAGAKTAGQGGATAALLSEKDKTSSVKALKAAGYDPDSGTDRVTELLNNATGGAIGQGVDWVAGTSNITLKGKAANASLETLANTIVMDMMGGKLGAGISNADREFIVGQLGKVSNASEPIGARKAAWETAKNRLISVGVPMGGGRQTTGAITPSSSGPKKVTSLNEAMKLPSGTVFIDPNGVERVRP
jgi:hypothetical protein